MTAAATLFARETGSGAIPAVFLHGFGGVSGIWSGMQDAVAAERLTLAYDLPGHGRSLAYPGAGPAKVAVRAVLADLAARGIERAHLIGHSMGGAIAALIALFEPSRAASLTLVAPGGFGEEINAPLLKRYARAVGKDDISACLAEMSGPGHEVAEEAVRVLAAARAMPGQTERLAAISEIIATADGKQGVIPRDGLAALEMPASVLWGTSDSVLPYHQAGQLPSRLALHTFAGAGHMLPDERPQEVLFLIRQNLR